MPDGGQVHDHGGGTDRDRGVSVLVDLAGNLDRHFLSRPKAMARCGSGVIAQEAGAVGDTGVEDAARDGRHEHRSCRRNRGNGEHCDEGR
jgi:hypothetical protein